MTDTSSRPDDAAPAADEPLHSWKEIAVYLHRDVRTVQRWEKSEGLPVHRHWHRVLGSVYAHKVELDAWWNNHRAELEIQEPVEPGAAATLPSEDISPHRRSVRFWTTGAGLLLFGVGIGLLAAAVALWRPKPQLPPKQKTTGRLLATINGSSPDSQTGGRVLAEDINGDGFPDAIVSAATASETGIFFGGNLRNARDFADEANVLVREEHGHLLLLMGAADINGDGIADLIWWEELPDPENYSANGLVMVLFGRRQWKSRLSLPSDADLRLSIAAPYNVSFLFTASSVRRDLNGDGIDDLILTAGDFSPPGRASAGAVFVLWGRRKWPKEMEITASADVTIWGAEKGEGLYAVEVGDVNGDGKNDLVVAAGDGALWGLRQFRGHAYVFLGHEHFPRRLDARNDYDVLIDGAQANDFFSPLALGDMNGDGIQDILVGSPGSNSPRPGRVLAYFGRHNWTRHLDISQADWKLLDSEPYTQFGQFLTTRDLNRDGYADLIVCAPPSRRNQIFVFYGGSHLQDGTPSAAADFGLRGDDPNGATCSEKPAVADFDGNGTPEILTGAQTALVSGKGKVGKAYIFAPYLPMQIDIRPGAYPNAIWPGTDHVVAIAIPVREGFDPQTLDTSSLRFAGVAPTSSSGCQYDVAGAKALCVFFDSKEMRLKPSDRIGVLTSRTKDGTLVFGADSVLVLQGSSSKPK